jgi:DNA uptake protein ComE-like DNA-binding protein
MARHAFVCCVLSAVLIGCAHGRARSLEPSLITPAQLVEGSAVAIGLLDFMNDHGHDGALLDHDIGLDRRASEAIVAHRLGPDARQGTDDDGIFSTLAELDAVSWVGPASMQKLAGYADALGYMQQQQRTVGCFEGVTFTFDKAERTLLLVNTMSAHGLDHQVKLDRRAVDSIVAARPIRSIAELSELYWVGPSALARLEAHASVQRVASR